MKGEKGGRLVWKKNLDFFVQIWSLNALCFLHVFSTVQWHLAQTQRCTTLVTIWIRNILYPKRKPHTL